MTIIGYNEEFDPVAVVQVYYGLNDIAFLIIGALLESDDVHAVKCGAHTCVKVSDTDYTVDGKHMPPCDAEQCISFWE